MKAIYGGRGKSNLGNRKRVENEMRGFPGTVNHGPTAVHCEDAVCNTMKIKYDKPGTQVMKFKRLV